MKKLVYSDVLPPRLYAAVRDEMRAKVMALKQHRRIALGDVVTIVFENRATLIFQICEMLRAESIEAPAKIQAEIDTYNTLLPAPGELSATLFVEITEQPDIRPMLERMVGIDEHVALEVDGERVRAEFEPGRSEADRISSVQYLRFRLPAAAIAKLGQPGTSVALCSDHPRYAARTLLSEATRASLAADFG